jgi:hypothetical protein
VNLRLEVLPAPQREFWDEEASHIPPDWVLYGGTAIALRLGHRQSVDFDFFSNGAVDYAALAAALPCLTRATTLRRAHDTLVVAASMKSGEIRLSFFGELKLGRVGTPDRISGKPAIASPLDLLATKLKVLHDRIEAKDYQDVEALLRSGLSLNAGVAAAQAVFGAQINPIDTVKMLTWFKDGDLERRLSAATRQFLEAAAANFDPATPPPRLAAATLADRQP